MLTQGFKDVLTECFEIGNLVVIGDVLEAVFVGCDASGELFEREMFSKLHNEG